MTIAGDWNNLSSAANPFIEGTDTATVTFDGTNLQGISSNSGETFYNLIINNTGSGVLMNNLVNATNLTLTNGALNLNSYTLIIQNANTAAVTRTNGYVVSETNLAVNPSILTWNMGTTTGSFIFPFGATGGSYIPVTFNKTSSGSSNVSISTRATATTDNQPLAGASDGGTIAAVTSLNGLLGADISTSSVIDRWWDIYPSAAVIADVTFSYRGSENTTSDPTSEIGVQHWTGSIWNNGKGGSNGTYSPTGINGVTSGVGSVTATGLTEFSPYVLVLKSNPLLPVELLSFTAEVINNTIELQWETASETNNDFFTVEKSKNAINFETVTIVGGAGNSNELLHYSAKDYEPYQDISYYRLKQTDFDGQYTYSDIVPVNFFNDNNTSISWWQEGSSLNLNINSSYSGEGIIEMYDYSGKLLSQKNIYIDSPFMSCTIETGNLSAGMYILRWIAGDDHKTSKIILQSY